jgi:DNA-binding SARP family transcriptional activator
MGPRTKRTIPPTSESAPSRAMLSHDRGAADAVRIWLLGGFRVSVGSQTIGEDRWRRRKAAVLLKLLALAPSHRMHREQMMDLLWPDLGGRAAANNLRRTLYAARRTLELNPLATSRYLTLRGGQLALCPEGDLWVDVEAFEQAAAAARRSRDPAAYQAALDLYAGELLPTDHYEEWAEEHRRRLRETRRSLLLGLARLQEERADHDSAAEALRKVLAEDPVREEAHVGLMRLYASSGRSGEALRQYGRLSEALSRELGAEPSACASALNEEIASGRFPVVSTQPSGPQQRKPQEEWARTTCQPPGPASSTASARC